MRVGSEHETLFRRSGVRYLRHYRGVRGLWTPLLRASRRPKADRLGSSRSAVVAPHPLRDQPAYQVGAASASGDSDKRMVCAMPKTGGTVDRVDLTDHHPDAVTAIFGLGRFLAMVKNIDHYLSQVRFPPRAASLRREQGSHSGELNAPVQPRCAVPAATRTPASWLCSGEPCSSFTSPRKAEIKAPLTKSSQRREGAAYGQPGSLGGRRRGGGSSPHFPVSHGPQQAKFGRRFGWP